ncbi:uncharacterized protein Dwil_GK28243, partial [Drosophila willistoni]
LCVCLPVCFISSTSCAAITSYTDPKQPNALRASAIYAPTTTTTATIIIIVHITATKPISHWISSAFYGGSS